MCVGWCVVCVEVCCVVCGVVCGVSSCSCAPAVCYSKRGPNIEEYWELKLSKKDYFSYEKISFLGPGDKFQNSGPGAPIRKD